MALPIIEGLPAIEHIEVTDKSTGGMHYVIAFKDGRQIVFSISRTDMIEFSRSYPGKHPERSLFTKRARQVFDALVTPATEEA